MNATVKAAKGVNLSEWIEEHKIEEIECLLCDMAGIMRGKFLPSHKFLREQKGLRIPEAVFMQCVTGNFIEESEVILDSNPDINMIPVSGSIRSLPWYDDVAAQVICDAEYINGKPVEFAPRYVLKRILELYKQAGWKPMVAPELEFYFVQKNLDPDLPLETPVGLSGRKEAGRQAYGIEAANDFDPVMDLIYDYSAAMNMDIETMAHEAGNVQMEVNFNYGDPLELADQVFLFKRLVRQAALKHNMHATFMAKPHQNEPGSAMHIHQSVLDVETGNNIFATDRGRDSKYLKSYIGGLQKYISAAMPLFAPFVNSYRRISPYSDAPINVHWGHDNRTVGLRIPHSDGTARRVENRVPGVDANPYLAIAGTLACGYLGMKNNMKPKAEITDDAYRLAFSLPKSLHESLSKLHHCRPLKEILGESFVKLYMEVKSFEYDEFNKVISSWERENLLLNV